MLTLGRSYMAKAHMQPGPTGEPGKAPAWYLSSSSAATMRPSRLAPSLTSMTLPAAGPVPRNTSSRLHDLDRAPRLLRQRQRHRLEIDQGLAAEAAADLGRHHADVGDVDAEQFGAIGAHHELALARAPDRALPVRGGGDDAGMRL